jgi:hypothetical protein
MPQWTSAIQFHTKPLSHIPLPIHSLNICTFTLIYSICLSYKSLITFSFTEHFLLILTSCAFQCHSLIINFVDYMSVFSWSKNLAELSSGLIKLQTADSARQLLLEKQTDVSCSMFVLVLSYVFIDTWQSASAIYHRMDSNVYISNTNHHRKR